MILNLHTCIYVLHTNTKVPVSILEGGLDEDNIRRFACVVLIEYPLSQAISIGDFCHTNGIKFITADTFGVMGSIFCDFGENFSISDASGEPPATVCLFSFISLFLE